MIWRKIIMVMLSCVLIGLLLVETVQAEEIGYAIEAGSLARVKELLKANPKLKLIANKANGNTPLHMVAHYHHDNHKKIAEFLLVNGADVNAKDKTGHTPLYWASNSGCKEIVGLLLANGADVNAKGDYGTSLHGVTSNRRTRHKEIIALLLAHDADVNARNKHGWTPLHKAVYGNYKETVELLIANGADIDIKVEDGYSVGFTPLHFAIQRRYNELADLLLTKESYIDIFVASARGMDKQVETLLDVNPNLVNAKIGIGETPVHWAVQYKHMEMVKLLLSKGADVNAKDRSGVTPLHLAARAGSKAVAEFLLSNDADIEAKKKYGFTPLHLAVQQNHKGIVELLLEKGADVNVKDEGDWAPLRWTAKRGETGKMNFLSGENSVINGKILSGSPMYRASQEDRKEMVELLCQYGGVEQ